jgi:hypothetical protein
VDDGHLEVGCDTTGTVEHIDAALGCGSVPTLPFKTSPHPKNPESRVLLHAIGEAVEEVGVSWDDVGLVWRDDSPSVVFNDSVSETHIDAIRGAVEERTPEDLVPEQRRCETLQLQGGPQKAQPRQ